jgi:hypothetical protein
MGFEARIIDGDAQVHLAPLLSSRLPLPSTAPSVVS